MWVVPFCSRPEIAVYYPRSCIFVIEALRVPALDGCGGRLRQHPSKRRKRKPNKNHTKNHRFKITRFRRVKVGCCLFLQWQQQIVIICALPAVPWPPAQLRLLHLERAHRGQAMQLRVHPKAPCRARPARPTATQDGGQRSCGSRPSTPNAFPLPSSAAVGRRRGHSATSG